jgi:hypothetical protein
MPLADVINVARRLSARNEPDLLQETYVRYSEEECAKMASALSGSLTRLPKECRDYVGLSRKTKNTAKEAEAKKTPPPEDPFAGLPPGEAAAAKAARLKGRDTHAVLQRRMTRTRDPPSRAK